MHPLIFIPTVRDLPEVKEAVDKLPYDTLWVKYRTQKEAYAIARGFFLSHDHTHLVIVPDIIITKEQIEQLLTDKVMSGWCVHGKTKPPREGLDTNTSYTFFKGEPIVGSYEDYNHITIEEVNNMDPTDMVKQVGFAGFAPTVIPRNIVKQIPFRVSGECCVDSCFAQDLYKANIKQYVDFRVKTIECDPTNLEVYNQLGKKKPEVIFNGNTI